MSWAFVEEASRMTVNEEGALHLRTDDHRTPWIPGVSAVAYAPERINACRDVCPMQLIYVRSDDPSASTTWTTGPRFKYKMRGPGPSSGSSGTMSHSSRSTAQQSKFRGELWRRDGTCIITDEYDAEAAHILPQSRPEYYVEVLGFDPVYYFDVSFGLLLEHKLHRRWDLGDWALYPDPAEPSNLLVHVFEGINLKQHHGKKIPSTRFRGPLRPPSRQLLEFHYRQCILKHMRGFDCFPDWQPC